jgi:hypothetical protein
LPKLRFDSNEPTDVLSNVQQGKTFFHKSDIHMVSPQYVLCNEFSDLMMLKIHGYKQHIYMAFPQYVSSGGL